MQATQLTRRSIPALGRGYAFWVKRGFLALSIDLPEPNSREVLGGCASLLVASYAGRRQWHLKFLSQTLAALCGGCIEGMQFFSGFEANRLAGGNADLGAGSRVAADASFAGTDAEDAETAQFNAVACSQGILEALEDRIHSCLSLGSRQACPLDHVMDNILLDQNLSPLVEEFICACA